MESPWTPAMLALHAVGVVAGLVVMVVGAVIVREERVYDDQVPGISLAIAGAVIANGSGLLLLIAGRRAVLARRIAVLGAVPGVVENLSARPSSDRGEQLLVGSAGLAYFHRSDCTLAQGRGWPAAPRADHESSGRQPCGVCRP